jgi:hypothetical protein
MVTVTHLFPPSILGFYRLPSAVESCDMNLVHVVDAYRAIKLASGNRNLGRDPCGFVDEHIPLFAVASLILAAYWDQRVTICGPGDVHSHENGCSRVKRYCRRSTPNHRNDTQQQEQRISHLTDPTRFVGPFSETTLFVIERRDAGDTRGSPVASNPFATREKEWVPKYKPPAGVYAYVVTKGVRTTGPANTEPVVVSVNVNPVWQLVVSP